jgi:hypothetical protein
VTKIRHAAMDPPARARPCGGYVDVLVFPNGECDAGPIIPVEESPSDEVAILLLVADPLEPDHLGGLGLELTLDQAAGLADCIRGAVDNAKGFVR